MGWPTRQSPKSCLSATIPSTAISPTSWTNSASPHERPPSRRLRDEDCSQS